MNASARRGRCRSRREPGSAAAPRLPRIGPASPTRASASALLAERLAQITAPRNGMNIGADAFDALAPQLDHVAHLVHEQQQHEADRELPAPDQRVGGDRDQHRARGREQLDLRQQQEQRLELRAELHEQRGASAPRGAKTRRQSSRGRPEPGWIGPSGTGRGPVRLCARWTPSIASVVQASYAQSCQALTASGGSELPVFVVHCAAPVGVDPGEDRLEHRAVDAERAVHRVPAPRW